MRKRVVRAVVFIAVALGVAVGAAEVAGATNLHAAVSDGVYWD